MRRGRLADLAEFYPPHPLPDTETLSAAARAALAEADDEICAWLQFPPQTNEVARSAVLYPGLMLIAAETKLPLALYEIGASAGLNLIPDKYAYRLGGRRLGDAGSPVVLSPLWSGARPGGIEPEIRSRRGCDRSPLEVSNPAHMERLISYVWPDQSERLSRVEAAGELVRQNAPELEQADAADWVERVIGEPAEAGLARVLFHSIAYQYFPDQTKARIAAQMDSAGGRATAAAPLAWLAFEQYESLGPRLTLRLWPGGGERVIAVADAHVREIEWRG